MLPEPMIITFLIPEYLLPEQSFESILYELAQSERENASTCCFLKARQEMEDFHKDTDEQEMIIYRFTCIRKETLRLYYWMHHYFGFNEVKDEPRASFGHFILLSHYLYHHKIDVDL